MKLLRFFSLLTTLCILFSLQSTIAQICLPLPAISSAPAVGAAPPGYNVWQNTPDIISGNGAWPGGGYTVSNVNGTSAAGGTMGMFLQNGGAPASQAEGWQTTFTGLTIGQTYSVSCQWQQATLSGGVTYSGGNLHVTVNGIPTLFTSSGGVGDPWQVATVTFTATATTAVYQFRVSEFATGPGAFYGSFIVVDNYPCPTVPPFSVSLNTGSVCAGQCINLQAMPLNGVGTISYNWNNGIGNAGAGPILVCPTSTTTYTVTATDGAGTVTSASTTIIVNPVPTVNLGTDMLICNGSPVTLNAGNPGATYLWNNSTTAQTLNVSTSGNYWVTTSLGGCTDVDTIAVTFQNVSVNLGNDITLCSGATATLNAGNPGATYLWSDNSTGQTLTVSAAGTYSVQVTIGGCTASDALVVTTQNVNVNLGPDATICQGASVLFNAGNPGATYLWNNSTTNQTLNASTSGTYWVQVTNGGCSDSDTVSLNVIALAVNLGNDQVLCQAPSFVLDAGNPSATYLWSDNSTSQQLNVSAVGTYWVEVTQGVCSVSDTINVSVNVPTLNFGPDISSCASSVTLDAQNSGSSYEWQDGSTNQTFTASADGTYWAEVTNPFGCSASDTINLSFGSINVDLGNDTMLCTSAAIVLDAQNVGATYVWQDGSTNQTYTTTTAGTYWVEVTKNGCTSSDTIVLSIGTVSVNLGNDTLLCNGATLLLDAQLAGLNYTWQDGSTNQTFTVTAAGTYSVNVVNGMCSGTDAINVTYGGPSLNLGPDVNGCNLALTFNAQNAGSSYVWQDGSTNQTFNTSTDGTYWVEVTDANGCTTSDTVIVSHTDPIASFSLGNTTGCSPLIVPFTDLSVAGAGSITQWSWNFGDNTSSAIQNPTHSYTSSNVYPISLTVTNSQGCTDTETQSIAMTVYDQPDAAFTFNPNPAKADQEVFFTDQSTNATSWWWEFGDNSTSTVQNPVHTYANAGNFTAMLVATNGICTDTARVTISIEEELIYYLPNSFTPDGDEFNQTFQPVFTDGFDPYDFNMLIYDRWGEVIFESNDATVGWDGTYQDNTLVQDGTYTWRIEFKERMSDKRHIIVGHVNVLK